MLIPKVLIDNHQLNFPEKICNLEDVAWTAMALCYVENIVFIETELYHYREILSLLRAIVLIIMAG